MKTSWIVFLLFAFVAITYISGVVELQTLGADKVAVIQGLMSPSIPEYNNPVGAVFTWVNIGWSYLQLFFYVLWFGFPTLFTGTWGMLQFLVFFPISIAIIFSIIIVMRGVPNR